MTFDCELIDVPSRKAIQSIRLTVYWKGFRQNNESVEQPKAGAETLLEC